MAVINSTNLANSEANQSYYEAEVAEAAQLAARTSLATYYATPTPARWISLSCDLVQDGAEIQPGEITRAFEGHAPRAFRAKDRKGRETETTEIAGNIGDPERKAATDVTVSQPKSFSALVRCAELAGDADLARMLRQAKQDVIRDVVCHAVDIGLVRTRRGHGGKESEVPKDFMVAVVPHARSRAGDAQEHDHVLFYNGCLRHDGTTGTLDLSPLVTHKFYLQGLVGAALAKRVQDLGFAVVESGRGQWEIAGAPEQLLAAWSKRREEVLANLKGTAGELAKRQREAEKAAAVGQRVEERPEDVPTIGRNKTEARRQAKQASALKSRRSKDELPDEAGLDAKDRREIAAVGLTPDGVVEGMRAAALRAPALEGDAAEAAIQALFERTSVATMRQFRTAVAEAACARGMSVADVEAAVQAALASGAVKAIGATEKGECVLSTDVAIEMECRMLVGAREGVGEGSLTVEAVDRAVSEIEAAGRAKGIKNFALAEEQIAFVRHFARGDQVVVGEGLAGTGKTTAMSVVVRAAHAGGMHTIGAAPTNAAAETLKAETGTREHLSIQKLAIELRMGRRTLKKTDYVLIDEAGMAELGDVAEVVKAARETGAQVGLVGDERQFAPIGSGAPFVALASVLGTSRLGEIRRQRVGWQNQASRLMAAGDADAGLMSYAAEGRWTFGSDRQNAMGKLRDDWAKDMDRKTGEGGEPATRIVIAQRNEDVHDLNAMLRQVLIDRGRLGADEFTVRTLHRDGGDGQVRDLRLRAGDQLVVWRRVPDHNLNNGDRLTVVGLQPIPGSRDGDVMLTWRAEKTGVETTAPLSTLTPPPAPDDPPSLPRLPFLQHAYALTQYSAQGKTVDRSFVYGGLGLDLRAVYVALTRHRDDARIYWDKGGIAQELREEGQAATRENVVDHIRREARRMAEKFNVIDFVSDVDAWLATGDIRAERPLRSSIAARVEAAERNAEATVRVAMQSGPEAARAVAEAAAIRPPSEEAPRQPRRSAEARADAAFEREARRLREAVDARDRRGLRRFDGIVRAIKAPGGGGAVAATLRDAPRRMREDLAEAAARAIPAIGEVLARWRRGWSMRRRADHLDQRRREIDDAGEGAMDGVAAQAGPSRGAPADLDPSVWRDAWMRETRIGPYAPAAQTLDLVPTGREAIASRVPVLPDGLRERLGSDVLAALAFPELGATPADAPTISAGAYAESLERERAGEEERIVAGMARWSGKAEDEVRRDLAEAFAKPEAIEHHDLRDAVRRARALAQARDAVIAALADGRLRKGAPVRALDPHLSPAAWRGELRRAERAVGDHSPPPDAARDRAAFNGERVTVRQLLAMLRARRAAQGHPSGVAASAGSAAAQLDGAIGTLREAVSEGRLSARAPIAAVAPSDRAAWRVAFRNAAFETARQGGATRSEARRHGREADAAAFDQARAASETQQSLAARDVPARAAEERAVRAALEAVREAGPPRPGQQRPAHQHVGERAGAGSRPVLGI